MFIIGEQIDAAAAVMIPAAIAAVIMIEIPDDWLLTVSTVYASGYFLIKQAEVFSEKKG